MERSKSITHKKASVKSAIIISIVLFTPPFSEFLNSFIAVENLPFNPLYKEDNSTLRIRKTVIK